jgi:excinuclease UvrABC helicase subunit UvrB
MMRARALAHQSLAKNDHAVALRAIDEGIKRIQDFLEEYDQSDQSKDCNELDFLLRWRREVEGERTVSPVERLERQLASAVAREHYEEAARVRDQLRRFKRPEAGSRPKAD